MEKAIFILMLFVGTLSQALNGWAINKGIYILKTRYQKIIHQISYYAFWFGIGWGFLFLAWTDWAMSFGGLFLSFIFIHRLISHPATHLFCVLFQTFLDSIVIISCLILWLSY
jgi:small-conductance mechanosensitive channel